MKTQEISKRCALFIGYQKDERVGGVRAWYEIQAPGDERHLSTVFAPTLIELGIPIPKTPPYFPDSKFDSVWVFKCENDACHISYLDKAVVVEHAKKSKHYQIVQELVTMTQVKKTEVPGEKPDKAIIINENDTVELDEAGEPVKKKKPALVLIDQEGKGRIAFNSAKDALDADRKTIKVPEVVTSKVIDYTPKVEKFVPASKEEIKKQVDAAVLAFRKRIHAAHPEINWEVI